MANNTKVTKTALITMIADKLQISQSQGEKYLNSFIELITEHLQQGNEITITGFGTFSKATRKARKGVNPKTGESINIAESTSVRFKAGKTLKDSVS